MIRNKASERQVQAARPDTSTWLAANAGSGKTRVLTDRVARLLLEGTDPQKILCLTYTKAAAGEMQNRLFKRLGAWAMLEDPALTRALQELGVDGGITPDRLRQARTLFARAVETPGGLKIQTIHSFCATLLRRFPLEAGVSPAFREMDDRAAALLAEDILHDIAEGPDHQVLDDLCYYVEDQALARLVRDIVTSRTAFSADLSEADLRSKLGIAADLDEAALTARAFLGEERALRDALIPHLRASGSNDNKAADKLETLRHFDLRDLPLLESVFLYGPKAKAAYTAKIDKFPTQDCQKALGPLQAPLNAWMQRVEDARQQRLALAAARKTAVLHRFARVFLHALEDRKRAQGWLDFDDLIQRARHLLSTPDVADWVLYRLDGGIDHILVDEAQDTSPDQWDVIEKLAREFTAGSGARDDVERTLFVVGDKKQSIYSFQGADPKAFDQMQAEFGRRFEQIGGRLEGLTLEHSFRSSDAILRLTDLVFAGRAASGFPSDGRHIAFKSDLPGRVDLWPPVEERKSEEDRHWTDPVDKSGTKHHAVVLAEHVADCIQHMLAHETLPVDTDTEGRFARRPVQAGDVLILLRRRSDLFSEIIRACKARGLPIAGADRLKVGAELAVRDLAALLRFLATPEDSLSLAEVLRSPLFGWSEQALFDLAHRREGPFLWQALRNRREEFPETLTILDDLRTQSDFLRPYDLIERALTRHGGRKALLARLGPEAEDGINALLSQALSYEQNQVPSLTGFLVWMETDDLEIKRQSDSSGGLIRVMTVHGSKGLESPIVFLPDTAIQRAPPSGPIMTMGPVPFWRPNADQMPAALVDVAEESRDREMRERDRLLYVAMTRAEKWLIVAAAGKTGAAGDSWYADIAAALQDAGALPAPMPPGPGLRYSHADWDALPLAEAGRDETADVPPPDAFTAPRAKAPRPQISPSDLGGAKALPGDAGHDSETATARGTLIHTLLDLLPARPAAEWNRAGAAILPEDADPGILPEVLSVLSAPDLAWLFGPGTLSEVPISAPLGRGQLIGVIDRLIVRPDRILAVDFKSNAVTPATPDQCPEGLLRQMGAYAHALQQVYPDRPVETGIVWTRTAQLMWLPHDIVTQALTRTAWVDDAQGST